jgi:hypothetical protein
MADSRDCGVNKMDLGMLGAADPGLLFWMAAVLHVVGLASTFLARLPQSQRGCTLCHGGFLACLVCVAAATFLAILVRSDWWVWSGTVFSIMAVGGTADLGAATAAGVEV